MDTHPGFATDLLFDRYQGNVVDHEQFWAVRTPDAPDYYFGNYLLLPTPPSDRDKGWLEASFDKLIGHALTQDAYKFYSATGGQPLREDVRRAFPFAGILFEEYNGSVTLSNGTSERLIPAGEGIAFPLGTFDTFTTYGGPANLLETANTLGLPLYARQMIDAKGRWIDLMTEASILPVNKRPRLAIRIFSSN